MSSKKRMKQNKSENSVGALTVPVILAAINGDTDALRSVVNRYQYYINALATKQLYDEYGNVYSMVDEELRQKLEIRLIVKIMKFKPRTA